MYIVGSWPRGMGRFLYAVCIEETAEIYVECESFLERAEKITAALNEYDKNHEVSS